ncbi:1-deoxy-D-xylulose-5-phosphate synthase N-terminal domain-containing protein [Amycolatopsis saalfeldensis]|uniref:Transketolase n=1 Tax=Amycolatopsis saalfeldensis TaxID=394193 RepID=A0A1H8VFW6_9PSEU|nr:1-deoxy-D-xylulose-5-phosphate synthase N-terminal domain-containing protein [Amycolatopsis saalfeldensis]SEP14174.1 transketolase [Amycolatopsis saalfeldensis]
MTNPSRDDDEALRRAAWRIRRRAVDMVAIEGYGYLGQALSSAELAAALYLTALRPGHDRLVVSPGHYSIVHFAAGVEVGLVDPAELATYGRDGSRLEAIGTEQTPGLTATCGSLGQGLSVAAGLALAQRLAGSDRQVYVLMSDGEMEEGQVWEAALFSAHHGLGNLTVVLDRNNSQVDGPTESITTLHPVADKWRSFGWEVGEADGHDVAAIRDGLARLRENPRPSVLIGSTWTLSGLDSVLPDEADGHFLKLDPDTVEQARKVCAEGEANAVRVPARTW